MAERLRVMRADNSLPVADQNNTLFTVGYDQAIPENEQYDSSYRTQDISQLLDTFINEVRKILPSDGIEYSEDTCGLYFMHGIPGKHRCDYTIRLGEQSLGKISFTRETEYREAELTMFENLIAGLVLPLQKALHYQRAIRFALRDELTGLRNSIAYYDAIGYEIERARRYKIPFSLLLVNLDNFSNINRRYGDDVGNAVLVEIAKRLENDARHSDIIYRKGGDEFLVFLPNAGKTAAVKAASRLKKTVLEVPLSIDNAEIRLTTTIGVVCVSLNDTAYTLIDRADRILNRAKILGKDRVLAEAGADNVLAEQF